MLSLCLGRRCSCLTRRAGTAVDVANDCMIVEGKQFEIPNSPDAIDPLFRQVTIGEYNTMFDTVSQYLDSNTKYASHMRDIFVYDEDKDNFARITLKNALESSCRFGRGGDLFFMDDDFVKNTPHDMFINNNAPVRRLGDMREDVLPYERIADIAKVVVDAFPKDAQFKIDLANTMAFLDKLKSNWGAEAAAVADHFKKLDYKADGALPDPGTGIPYGFGSYHGLLKVAGKSGNPDQKDAELALKVFNQIFDFAQTKFSESLAVNANYRPGWIKPDLPELEKATFFALSLIHI